MITSKQRAYLRSLSNKIDPIFQVGKGGIEENFYLQVNQALETRELIKLTVLDTSMFSAKEAAQDIADKTNSEIVHVIGSKFVLYKQSINNKRIEL